jgi:hypothetical protein
MLTSAVMQEKDLKVLLIDESEINEISGKP